MPPKKNQ